MQLCPEVPCGAIAVHTVGHSCPGCVAQSDSMRCPASPTEINVRQGGGCIVDRTSATDATLTVTSSVRTCHSNSNRSSVGVQEVKPAYIGRKGGESGYNWRSGGKQPLP